MPEEGDGADEVVEGWSVVGCRVSVVSRNGDGQLLELSSTLLACCGAGGGRGGRAPGCCRTGLATGEGNWALQQLLQLASDQRTIQGVGAWVRAGVE